MSCSKILKPLRACWAWYQVAHKSLTSSSSITPLTREYFTHQAYFIHATDCTKSTAIFFSPYCSCYVHKLKSLSSLWSDRKMSQMISLLNVELMHWIVVSTWAILDSLHGVKGMASLCFDQPICLGLQKKSFHFIRSISWFFPSRLSAFLFSAIYSLIYWYKSDENDTIQASKLV